MTLDGRWKLRYKKAAWVWMLVLQQPNPDCDKNMRDSIDWQEGMIALYSDRQEGPGWERNS